MEEKVSKTMMAVGMEAFGRVRSSVKNRSPTRKYIDKSPRSKRPKSLLARSHSKVRGVTVSHFTMVVISNTNGTLSEPVKEHVMVALKKNVWSSQTWMVPLISCPQTNLNS